MQEVHSRKRPHLEDSDSLPSKKRAVSVNGTTAPVNGNVHPNTEADDEPRDQDNLEVASVFSFIALIIVTRFYCSFLAIPQGGHFPPHEALFTRK